MLMANSAAIITDAFPAAQRGMALGINIVAAIAGSFIGLVLGGALSEWNWRSVFWVNVPIGIVGTIWAYKSLHDTGVRRKAKIDWWGNATFAVGLTVLLAGITYGIQPYGGHTQGWSNPWVIAGLIGGLALLIAFCVVEAKTADPMLPLSLFRNREFASGNLANLLGAIARGGLQFMLIIWLQGIWLPLHGYDYKDTPLWAGLYMIPLTIGFLVAGPARRAPVRQVRAAHLRRGRTADDGGVVRRAAADPHELQLHGVRLPHLPQRRRRRAVLRAEHAR